jgi:hypothetical protein
MRWCFEIAEKMDEEVIRIRASSIFLLLSICLMSIRMSPIVMALIRIPMSMAI